MMLKIIRAYERSFEDNQSVGGDEILFIQYEYIHSKVYFSFEPITIIV